MFIFICKLYGLNLSLKYIDWLIDWSYLYDVLSTDQVCRQGLGKGAISIFILPCLSDILLKVGLRISAVKCRKFSKSAASWLKQKGYFTYFSAFSACFSVKWLKYNLQTIHLTKDKLIQLKIANDQHYLTIYCNNDYKDENKKNYKKSTDLIESFQN